MTLNASDIDLYYQNCIKMHQYLQYSVRIILDRKTEDMLAFFNTLHVFSTF